MESLTFYFDRCLGRDFPKALRILRCPFNVEDHWGMKFADDMPDDDWLEIVGKKKWIVFSHDKKWQRETANAQAIRDHQIGCFYLYGANSLNFFKMKNFGHNYEKIIKACKGKSGPFIYQVTSANRLRKVL